MPTSEGFAALFLAGFLFLLATNLMAGWLFFLVAFLIALLVVGVASASGAARAVRVAAAGGSTGAVEGGEVALPVWVEGRRGARFVRVAAEVGGRRGEAFLPRLRRGERRQLILRFPAPARGRYALSHLEITSHGLVGMFRVRRRVPADGEVLVRPRYRLLPALPEGTDGQGGALLAGRRRGSELVGTREYAPGDPTRHIHWRSSRRHRRLIVKEFDDPAAPAAAILIDAGGGQEREEFDRVVRAAASLAHTAIQRGLDVAVVAMDGRGPVRLRGTWEQVWEGLASLTADGPPLPEAMGRLAVLMPPGAVTVVVTSRAQSTPRRALLVGPAGAETPWEFGPDGEVARRWRA